MKARLLRKVRRRVKLYRPRPGTYHGLNADRTFYHRKAIEVFRENREDEYENIALDSYRRQVLLEARWIFGRKRCLANRAKRLANNRIR